MSVRWDEYFLKMANTVASQTRCLSRKVGAVVVKPPHNLVVSTGFNGPPIGVDKCWNRREIKDEFFRFGNGKFPDIDVCPRTQLGYKSGQGIQWCAAAHGERNAIDLAARMGHSTEGCIMYLNCGIPCMECSKTIIQAGIRTVVVTSMDVYEKDGITGKMMLDYGGVGIRTYDPVVLKVS